MIKDEFFVLQTCIFPFFVYWNVLCNGNLYNDWYMFYNIRLFNISVNEDLSFVIQYWYINVCSIRISKLSVNVDLPLVIQSILVVDWF